MSDPSKEKTLRETIELNSLLAMNNRYPRVLVSDAECILALLDKIEALESKLTSITEQLVSVTEHLLELDNRGES